MWCLARRSFGPLVALLLVGQCVTPAAAQIGRLLSDSSLTERDDHIDLAIEFACTMRYQSHSPVGESESVRIQLRPGPDCGLGGGGQFATERALPAGAMSLVRRMELSPSLSGGAELVIGFNRIERFLVAASGGVRGLRIRVLRNAPRAALVVDDSPGVAGSYAINLDSSRQPFARDSLARARAALQVSTYVSETDLDGVHWYRLRAGPFDSRKEAERVLLVAQRLYARAWLAIDDERGAEAGEEILPAPGAAGTPRARDGERRADAALDQALEKARRASTSRRYDEAVALLTRILTSSDYQRREQAQELLGLVRERKGQLAHAKAEYEEYLRRYPDGKAAERVRKRLHALRLANRPGSKGSRFGADGSATGWLVYGNAAQLYRRDNTTLRSDVQARDFVSQNAVINDIDTVARRHGERFDFVTRTSAGYIKDLMPESRNDQLRVSNAFVELRDREQGIGARAGRQSRGMAGVMGSFDGLLANWEWRQRIGFDVVAGMPVESSRFGPDTQRRFYGFATRLASRGGSWDTSLYAIAQQYYGATDRQSLGVETRYFVPGKTLVALLDYDLHFAEINSAMLLGTLVLPSRWTLNADASRQSSPILSARNALIGQPVTSFTELMQQFTPAQLEALAKDRSAQLTQFGLTATHPWGARAQWSINGSSVDITGTPASGGVEAIESTGRENALTGELLVSSVFREGDLTSFALRYGQGGTADIASLGVGTRLPLGQTLRLTSRLRVDRRILASDSTVQWLYLPSLRLDLQRRHSLFELEAGAELGSREQQGVSERNTRFFVSLGYRLSLDWDGR